MAVAEIQVQGSDGNTAKVVVDTITGQTYAYPVYKMTIGALSKDDGFISAANPLPVQLTNGTTAQAMSTFGEAFVEVRESSNQAILRELKKMNLQLSLLTDTHLTNLDVE